MACFLFLFSVPEPVVEVTTSSNDTLYQATKQSFFCTVTFPNLLPPDGIDVTFEWYFQGAMVENGTRVTVSNLYSALDPNSTLASSSITFSPINTNESGKYECSVGFSLVGSPANILPPGDQQRSIDVIVEGTVHVDLKNAFPLCQIVTGLSYKYMYILLYALFEIHVPIGTCTSLYM